MGLGAKIQQFREESGLSQKELANLVGVTVGMIAEWEAGDDAPTFKELVCLSKTLNVSADELLEATTEEVMLLPGAPKREKEANYAAGQKGNKTRWIVGMAIIIMIVVTAAFLLFRTVPFANDICHTS